MVKVLAWATLGFAMLFIALAMTGVFAWESLGADNARWIFNWAALPALGVSLTMAGLILVFSTDSEEFAVAGISDMALGGLVCLGGIVVTVATYLLASKDGGVYVVTWGAIAVGATQFVRGLLKAIGK